MFCKSRTRLSLTDTPGEEGEFNMTRQFLSTYFYRGSFSRLLVGVNVPA